MTHIVVTGKIPTAGLEVLRDAGFEPKAWSHDTAMSREELLQQVKGAEILVTLLTEKVDDELLEAAGPQLKAVCNVAVGYNNIDVAACKSRGVTVTNTPGVLTDATADIALALILMVTRRLAEGERVIRSKQAWQWGMHYMLGSGITNRILGVVGMGAIGIATARRAMKSTAFLINTARGPIVDEQALVEALSTREIAGAGLDVFEFEPKINDGLLDRDDVVLIPHLGSATTETRNAMAMLAANNAVEIANSRSALTPVS
ncbi:MAG: D-glycerate dehydrogenase [Actinobacteria bacterium]|nr:D-glycerate dehydrogenase [Actinomycetota bacterium]